MYKYFKYRIYPTKEQQDFLAIQFGGVRFVYNYFLNQRKSEYLNNKKSLNYYDNAKELTMLKNTDGYEWLYDITASSLQSSLRNLELAYTNFFAKRTRFPKFKKKNNNQIIKLTQSFNIKNNKLYIPKLKSGIKISKHRLTEGRAISIFISKIASNKYFVSFVCETEIKLLIKSNNIIGIDLGLTTLLTTSDGLKISNPKHNRKFKKKLAFKQKQLSKKQKGSNNRNKARLQIARINEYIANKRKDHLHKTTKKLINENQVIIAETLSVANMMKNHRLAYGIQDASWGELLRQLEYKSLWYGRTFYQIDRWFPSSKTCNSCQFVLDNLNLSIREWNCQNCHQHNDRDLNAALNIRDKGISDLKNLSVPGIGSDIKQKLDPSQEGNSLTSVNELEAFSSGASRKTSIKKSRRNKKSLSN